MKVISPLLGARGSRWKWLLAAATFVALVTSPACSGAQGPTATAGLTPQPTPDPVADPVAGGIVANVAGTEVEVELGEWFATAGRASAPAGYVTFEGKNKGKEAHEIVVMRTDLPADKLAVDAAAKKVDEGASGGVIGEIEPEQLGAGAEAKATFYLAPGKYVLFCNIAEHYQKGMWAPFEAKELQGGSLVVYSGRSKALVDPIIQQFAQATGIKVEVKYAGTPQIAATLLEEGTKSPADVFFAQDPGGVGAVEQMLSPMSKPLLEQVPTWARSPEGKWVGVSGRARVVVYNTKELTPADLPADIYDFVDPKWKGRIGWAPTNGSFQTMVTAMRALWGEAKTRQWLEGIKANQPKVYSGNVPVATAVANGEVSVGFINHYYIFQLMAQQGESLAARNYHPTAGGPGAMIMVSGAGILETSKNKENAERFIAFLLSVVGQQYFASQTYEYPLVQGVVINRLLTPLAEIKDPGVPMKDLADMAGTVKLLQDVGVL